MGTMPIGRLIIDMSVPMMLSMLVQSLYNIVDSMFVSRISEDALTGVSLVFPIQNLMMAVASGAAVGINALLSRHLGAKEYDQANSVAANGIRIEIGGAALFVVLLAFITEPFIGLQTKDPEIYAAGTTYMHILGWLCIGVFMQVTFERLLQSTGRTVWSMISQMTGAIINMIMDPILIFGLLGAPKMGVAGAAVATIFGQVTASILGLIFNMKKNPEITLSLKRYRLDFRVIRDVLKIGVPSMIMIAIGSITIFTMNRILMAFSSTAVAVYGVYFKLQSFVFMPVFGLNGGLVPIIAFNYGAKDPARIRRAIRLGAAYAVAIMLAGLAVFQLFPAQLLSIFDASAHMTAIGTVALRRISLSFVFAGYCIVSGSVFQAFGRSILSMFVSVMRQLAALLPLAWLFARIGGLDAVWWSIPGAELVSVTVTTIFLRSIFRHEIADLERGSRSESFSL